MAEPVVERIEYASSVDGTAPLFAYVAYLLEQVNLPVVVLMHGYREEAEGYLATAQRWAARYRVCVVVPEMRGRGGSAGRRDSGGVEVADILDAVNAVRERHAARIRGNNVCIVGYSGGGGNALACAVRFPDAFRVVVAFFPIADYAAWYYIGAGPERQAILREDIGGDPQALPGAYLARNAILAAANNGQSQILIFVDSEEHTCPPEQHARLMLRRAQAAGLENIRLYESSAEDEARWIHGHPETLQAAEAKFFPLITDAKAVPPVLPQAGKLHVAGYLITRGWECWLEDGRNGVAIVEYNLGTASGAPARWLVRAWTEAWDLDVMLKLYLDRLPPSRKQTSVRLLVNGREKVIPSGDFYVVAIKPGDEVRLEQVAAGGRMLPKGKK